jgi:hypothetical protein
VSVSDLLTEKRYYDVPMLEITSDHIALLNGADLRELTGRLCESELRKRGISAAFATWGGHQNAADGGLDVRVDLPPDSSIDGFIPTLHTGFQVKATDMPPSKIGPEMCPDGTLRPVIKELADQSGAYIIVTSQESTTGSALNERRTAMAAAVKDYPNASNLKLDLYDRTRIATWVRDHAGLTLWVRQKIGKAIQGWQPYGNWSFPPAGSNDRYLLDEKARIQTTSAGSGHEYSTLEGIVRLRKQLTVPGTAVRLVGLSGVGKTRLAQALFDGQVGTDILDPSLAVYTNMSDNPDPQPFGFVSDLIATQSRAVVVVDNCPADLHKRLSELCRSQGSTVNVLSVEYDIQDGMPEGTEVYELKPSSNGVIESLLKARFSILSLVDLHRIVEFSEGNARIAIALAATVHSNATLAGLNDRDLFERLFYQRQAPDNSLLMAAEICSLVYSFNGEDVSEQSELALLSSMIGKGASDTYQHVAELRRRDLVQHRSVWRAVLPHAIANRLATIALQNIPLATIRQSLVENSSDRLLTSFSRRLGYLHTSPEAASIVRDWLSPNGLLGDVGQLNETGMALFRNVAPVSPEATLAALERAMPDLGNKVAPHSLTPYIGILRSLAYEAEAFDRCIRLLKSIILAKYQIDTAGEQVEVFTSLFSPYLSGTHAIIEQRLAIIKEMLVSGDENERVLGVRALEVAIQASYFSSHYGFEFGARPRDFGYSPETRQEKLHWYGATVGLCESLINSNALAVPSVLQVVAHKFRGLWTWVGALDDLERLCQTVSAKQFWPDGWAAVRTIQSFDAKNFPPAVVDRLAAVELLLRAKNVVQQVRATVFGTHFVWLNLGTEGTYNDNNFSSQYEHMEEVARNLAIAVASDKHAFDELLPEMFAADGRMWSFGRGLAEGTTDVVGLWNRLVEQFSIANEDRRRTSIFQGFLVALNSTNQTLVNSLLDTAFSDETLVRYLPSLESVVGISQQGLDRLLRSLALGKTPIEAFRSIASGKATDLLTGDEFKKLVLEIAAKPGGYRVAILILQMRLDYGSHRGEDSEAEVRNAGRELIRRFDFQRADDIEDFELSQVARACLEGEPGASVVREMCQKLRDSMPNYVGALGWHESLMSTLFSVQPLAALDGFFLSDLENPTDVNMVDRFAFSSMSPFDFIEEDKIIAWCDRNAIARYPIAAAGITIFESAANKVPNGWSTKARRLLERAPDRVAVLDRFLQRFSPISWWGSRAAIIEAKTKLLDELDVYGDSALTEFAAQQQARLFKAINEERRIETLMDAQRDESFE